MSVGRGEEYEMIELEPIEVEPRRGSLVEEYEMSVDTHIPEEGRESA